MFIFYAVLCFKIFNRNSVAQNCAELSDLQLRASTRIKRSSVIVIHTHLLGINPSIERIGPSAQRLQNSAKLIKNPKIIIIMINHTRIFLEGNWFNSCTVRFALCICTIQLALADQKSARCLKWTRVYSDHFLKSENVSS